MTRMPTGWSPGKRTIPEMVDLYPESTLVRVYFAPGEGLPAAAWSDPKWVGRQRLSALPQGCTVIVSHKDAGVDALAFVTAWLRYRPDVRVILVAHHEPEQGDPGDPTRDVFRSSWTRQRTQVGGHPARQDGRLRLAVCYTLQWIRKGGDWRLWYPEHEADAVDLVLGDWYPYTPGMPNPYRPPTYEAPGQALQVMLDIARETGKQWGIGEIDHMRILKANGYAADLDPDGALCADWYRSMHNYAKRNGCKVWGHYHANNGAALGDLTQRPAEQQAFRELLAQEAAPEPEPEQPTTPVLTRADVEAAALAALAASPELAALRAQLDAVAELLAGTPERVVDALHARTAPRSAGGQ